jgi:leucyl-tRNA synthetase
MQRSGKAESVALREAVEVWIRLMAPFAPFTCEELWNSVGGAGFVSLAEWPKADEHKTDISAEENETILADLIEDTLNVIRATKITPKHIFYYTAAIWKRKVHGMVLEKAEAGEVKMNEMMRAINEDPLLKPHVRDAAAFVPRVIKTLNKLSRERKANILNKVYANESGILMDALPFLKDRFNCEITVYSEEDREMFDPKNRAQMAMPAQPAIYIE